MTYIIIRHFNQLTSDIQTDVSLIQFFLHEPFLNVTYLGNNILTLTTIYCIFERMPVGLPSKVFTESYDDTLDDVIRIP